MSGLPDSAWAASSAQSTQSGSAWLPASLLPLCPASLAQPGQPAQLRAAQSGSSLAASLALQAPSSRLQPAPRPEGSFLIF